MVTKEMADIAWQTAKRVLEGYDPEHEKRIAQAWAEMAKMSSQKKLMLEKQRNLRARVRCI